METSAVRDIASKLCRTAEDGYDMLFSLRQILYRMDWQGAVRDEFVFDADDEIQSMLAIMDALDRLGVKASREVDEWETIGADF